MKKESQVKIKHYITMMDSKTSEELDSSNPKLINVSRMMQIAWGCGRIQEVMEMGVQVASQAMEQDEGA
uniref:Signal recognition particle SRP54 subunit M-domain domain-containing protein n=1 Tax=Gossypium raimondii TaxID=29730 RepID=A0A0D2TIR9_GOSRA|nr:hypothetical protein B456_009G127100 [Gossypium raimondii]